MRRGVAHRNDPAQILLTVGADSMDDSALGVQFVGGENNLSEFAEFVAAAPMSEWAARFTCVEDC